MNSPRIIATRHDSGGWQQRLKLERVALDAPPVAVVSEVESIMGGWWFRAGGYLVGQMFGIVRA